MTFSDLLLVVTARHANWREWQQRSFSTTACHWPVSGWCPSCGSCSSFPLPRFSARLSSVDHASAYPLESSGDLHFHLSLHRRDRRGTTDDFTTSFLHFSLFSTAPWDLANSRSVHSPMLFSHLFFLSALSSSPFHCALQDGFGQKSRQRKRCSGKILPNFHQR